MADVFVKIDNMAVAHSLYSEVKENLCQCFSRSSFWKSVYPLFTQWLISSCPHWRWLAFGTCIWPNWSRPKLKRPTIPTGCPSPHTVPPATLALDSLAQFNKQLFQWQGDISNPSFAPPIKEWRRCNGRYGWRNKVNGTIFSPSVLLCNP